MLNNFVGKDIINIGDMTPDQFQYLLDLSKMLKAEKMTGVKPARFHNKNVVAHFEWESTRTRCAFEVGAMDLGMGVTYLDPGSSQMGKKESIEEILELAQLKKEGKIKKLVVTGCLGERYQAEMHKELPELDDDFAKDVSEYDTLDELKDSIRKGIQTNHEKQADQKVENDLIDQVVGGMKAEIPDAMIESRIEELVQDFQYRISQQGLKLEQYLQYMGMTMEQFKEQFREQADKQVKMRLAMEAIVAKESIEATEEEFEAEIKRIADAYQMEADKVKSLVDAAAVKKDLAVNKAIDFVKSKANIVAGAAEEKKPAKKTTRKTTKKAAAKQDEEPKEEETKGE